MATEGSFLTEEMRRKAVGVESQPEVRHIEAGAIRAFAEAVGDPNPAWSDEAAARKGRYGGITAPPTFLRSIRTERPELPFEIPFTRLLDGGSDWEYFESVRSGDRITAVARLESMSERSGRLGQMLFMITLTTYTNHLGEVVATQRSTSIRY